VRTASHSHAVPPEQVATGRRRLVAGLGAGALLALVEGCVTPPPLPPRPIDAARAPKVGDTWQYRYSSAWNNVAPRMLWNSVTSVTGEGVGDRLSVDARSASGPAQLFTSGFQIVAFPYPGLVVEEFSPYFLAFGPAAVGERGAVAMPPASWSQWTASARVVGNEGVTVPAGSFEATRVDIIGNRFFTAGMDNAADPVTLNATAWFAPAAKRMVRFTYQTQAALFNLLSRDLYELVSYQVA